eukprot:g20775.t1
MRFGQERPRTNHKCRKRKTGRQVHTSDPRFFHPQRYHNLVSEPSKLTKRNSDILNARWLTGSTHAHDVVFQKLSKKMHITCIALPARAGPPSPENCTHKSAGSSGKFTFGCTGDNEK